MKFKLVSGSSTVFLFSLLLSSISRYWSWHILQNCTSHIQTTKTFHTWVRLMIPHLESTHSFTSLTVLREINQRFSNLLQYSSFFSTSLKFPGCKQENRTTASPCVMLRELQWCRESVKAEDCSSAVGIMINGNNQCCYSCRKNLLK